MSENNYEELADPKNIIIERQETNYTTENIHTDSIEHSLLDMEDKDYNETAVNELVISQVNSFAKTNNKK